MIGIVGAAAITGGIISFTGHYWGWLFGGGFLSALGAGLLYTVGPFYPAVLNHTLNTTRCLYFGCQARWLSNSLRSRHRMYHTGMFMCWLFLS